MTSAEGTVGITEANHISTKVLAPPGGKTSISLTDDVTQSAQSHKDVNKCQVARNRSNVFSSTEVDTTDHDQAQRVKACQQQRQMSSVFGGGNQPAPIPRPKEPEPPRKPHIVNPHQEARQKSNLFSGAAAAEAAPAQTSTASKPSNVNPHQEKRQKSQLFSEVPPSEQSKPSVQVLAPPGGVSHITFG